MSSCVADVIGSVLKPIIVRPHWIDFESPGVILSARVNVEEPFGFESFDPLTKSIKLGYHCSPETFTSVPNLLILSRILKDPSEYSISVCDLDTEISEILRSESCPRPIVNVCLSLLSAPKSSL